ncbi:MAG TPA: CAP family protein [Kofleriaceae bacterium]|nr:CAP family protein [Kofleriaceae bacterium]
MRVILIASVVAACGPIYPDKQANPPPPQREVAGPPGGGAPADDPWATPSREEPRPEPRPDPRPDPRPEPRPDPRPRAGAAAPGDYQALVDAHNRYRAQHCAPPLTWSPKLADVAQRWANTLKAKGCMFGHSNGTFGENLAGGTSGTLDGQGVADMWYDEVKLYSFKSGGFSMKTGHFTQLVWRDTTQIGCGKTSCNGMDLWVCEYDPAGNVDTMYRSNVLPKGCR